MVAGLFSFYNYEGKRSRMYLVVLPYHHRNYMTG